MEFAYKGADTIRVNFGGFVPLSTVDWRGKSACVIFLRGCLLGCRNCHNVDIMGGSDIREFKDIIGLIDIASPLIIGVVFSGGEPTLQEDALSALARAVIENYNMGVSIQTSGINPTCLDSLIYKELVDKISIDIKPKCRLVGGYIDNYWLYKQNVQGSLDLCYEQWDVNRLEELEQVVTVFRGEELEIQRIINEEYALNGEVILQQGNAKGVVSLSFEELQLLASKIKLPTRIRTRDGGEVRYDPKSEPKGI